MWHWDDELTQPLKRQDTVSWEVSIISWFMMSFLYGKRDELRDISLYILITKSILFPFNWKIPFLLLRMVRVHVLQHIIKIDNQIWHDALNLLIVLNILKVLYILCPHRYIVKEFKIQDFNIPKFELWYFTFCCKHYFQILYLLKYIWKSHK